MSEELLHIECHVGAPDSLIVATYEGGAISISVTEGFEAADVILNETTAKKLRDCLQKYLGEEEEK